MEVQYQIPNAERLESSAKHVLVWLQSMTLLQYDKGNPKLPRHFKPSLVEDEFETPRKNFESLCKQHKIFPTLDVSATLENRKCVKFFSITDNALEQEWTEDFWCNHPHTLHAEFVEKCHQQWKKHNINGLQIIPANCMRTSYWHKFIEPNVRYYAIEGSIRFLQDGKPSKDTSRNAYVCVVWRAI